MSKYRVARYTLVLAILLPLYIFLLRDCVR